MPEAMAGKLDGVWRRFRAFPAWLQVAAWLAAWPFLVAVLLARRGSVSSAAAAVVVLLIGGPLWWIVPFTGDGTPTSFDVAESDTESDDVDDTSSDDEDTDADDAHIGEQRARDENPEPVAESELDQAAEAQAQSPPAQQPAAALPAGIPDGVQTATVARHVDGDTLWVEPVEDGPLALGAAHAIRLISIDTPETVHPTQPVGCYGPEASEFVKQTLPVGARVHLESDVEDTDRFGRFLRYLWTTDGEMFNEMAVAGGFAEVVVFPPNDRHYDHLVEVQERAQAEDAGLWGACEQSAEPEPTPAPAPQPAPERVPEPESGCEPGYDPCVPTYPPDVNCSDVNGPITVTGSDPHRLDGDDDGVGCEG